MKRMKKICKSLKNIMTAALCIGGISFILASVTACSPKDNNPAAQITLEQAEEIALADAGLTDTELISAKAYQVQNNGVSIYDIEFYVENAKYKYEIASDTGRIYSKIKEISDSQGDIANETKSDSVPDKTALPDQNTDVNQNEAATQNQKQEQISLDVAKTTALTDAGVSSFDATFTKEKLDYEDGIMVYEIEFYAGNTEYEYEINALTNAIYSREVEMHNAEPDQGITAAASADYIGNDQASSIALAHAGFTAADVTLLKIEFDLDDGNAVYEVDFYKDSRKYEYKINALDGFIIEYDMD